MLLGVGLLIAELWPGMRHLDVFGLVLLSAAALPLAVRERWPVPVLAVNILASVPFHANNYAHASVAPATMVALFTVAAGGNRRRTVLAGAAVLTTAGIGVFVVPHHDERPALAAVSVAGWIVAALVAGEAVHLHDAYIAEILDRAERAERAREENARQLVTAERLRIAHDLHDLLAHSITVIQVQAGVAGHLLAEHLADADKLATSLEAITTACVEARRELAATVGVLRESDLSESECGPLPGLNQLRALAEPAEAVGVSVDFVEQGESRALPPTVELVAYRIVQEALTNVAKHSGARRATVALGYRPYRLDLDVTDDGATTNGAATGGAANGAAANGAGTNGAGTNGGRAGLAATGFGIIGMAERAAAIGGKVTAGAVPGGFRVAATLPVRE